MSIIHAIHSRTLDLLNLQSSEEEPGVQYMALDRVSYLVIDEADRMLDISWMKSRRSFTLPGFQRTVKCDVGIVSSHTMLSSHLL